MRILVFGDSITQGFHDLERGGWCNRLAIQAMNVSVESDWETDVSVLNLGIGGDSLDRLHERFETEFRRRCSDICVTIFAFGINDSMSDTEGNCRVELTAFEKLYSEYIALAQSKGKVILVGLVPIDEVQLNPIPWFQTHSCLQSNRDAFNAVVERIATESGCSYVSLSDVYDASTHTIDGIHPNAVGHQLIFERVKETLEAAGIL